MSTTVVGVAPRPLLHVADRGGSVAPGTHRCEPSHPLRGRALVTNQRPPQRDGSLLRAPAVPDPSARSRAGGRGRRPRCPPVAPPNPMASTAPSIVRRQRLSRRRRRRATAIVDDRPSPGMPPRCQRASISFGDVTRRRARAPRCRPQNTGTDTPRAPTPGTGVACPPPRRGRTWRICCPRHASLRAVSTPPGQGAGHESEPTPEGRLVATRAGGVGSVGSISGRGKRTATPMSARRAAKSDRVHDSVDRSPSATQSSTPTTRHRHRRFPSVPGDATALRMRVHLFQGRHPSPCTGAALSSPEHGDGQAARADARHGRRLSPSATGPTVAALPPQACIAPSRPPPSGAGRWSRISAHPRGAARCYACRRCRFRRLDLGSGEEDGDPNVRPSRRQIRSRRRRP